jgi:hypothetical protein
MKIHISKLQVSVCLVIVLVALIALGAFFFHDIKRTKIIDEPAPLTTEEYNAAVDRFTKLVAEHNPTIALHALANSMDTDQRILNECHGIVHEIGAAAFQKYKDFATAIQYQDDLCGGGYLHGTIEAYFSKTKNIKLAMETLCSRYGISPEREKCYHGIGHGLMYYSNNDLPTSISNCSRYKLPKARVRCAEGVYMENFGTLRTLHPSDYLKPEDPLYPCSSQPSSYKGVCYYYAPLYYLSLHTNDYIGALRMCETVEEKYQVSCTKGVGSRAIKSNVKNIPQVENICMSGQLVFEI